MAINREEMDRLDQEEFDRLMKERPDKQEFDRLKKEVSEMLTDGEEQEERQKLDEENKRRKMWKFMMVIWAFYVVSFVVSFPYILYTWYGFYLKSMWLPLGISVFCSMLSCYIIYFGVIARWSKVCALWNYAFNGGKYPYESEFQHKKKED